MDRNFGFLLLFVSFLAIVAAQFFYSLSPGGARGGVVYSPPAPAIYEVAQAPQYTAATPVVAANGEMPKPIIALRDCATADLENTVCIETGPVAEALENIEPSLDIHSRDLKIGQTYIATFSLDVEQASQAPLIRYEGTEQEKLSHNINASMSFISDAFDIFGCVGGNRGQKFDFYCKVSAEKQQESTRLYATISYTIGTPTQSFSAPSSIVDLSGKLGISNTWQDRIGAFIEVYKPLVLGIGAIIATILTWVSGFGKLFVPSKPEQDTGEA